jgi:hypothetical protein
MLEKQSQVSGFNRGWNCQIASVTLNKAIRTPNTVIENKTVN